MVARCDHDDVVLVPSVLLMDEEFVRSDAGCKDEPVLHEQDERLVGERRPRA